MGEIGGGRSVANITRQFEIGIYSADGERERGYTLDSRRDGVWTISDAERQVRANLNRLQSGRHIVTIDVQVLRDCRIVQGSYWAQIEIDVSDPLDPEALVA